MKLTIEKYKEIDRLIESYELKYDDIDVTYIIRNYFVSKLRNKNNEGNKEINLNLVTFLRFLKYSITTLPLFLKKSKILVFSNAERRKKIDKYYFDRVTSIVSEKYSDALYIENPIISNHKKPSKDKVLSESIFFIFSFLFSFLYFNKKNIKIDTRFTELCEKYDLKLNNIGILKRFIGQYKFMSFYIKYINRPEKVFEAYPNGYYGYNYAFKQNKIPIIELQHGIVYSTHPSYNCILTSKVYPFSPDFIFTYGYKDKEVLENLNYLKKEHIFVVGSYGLEKSKKDNSNVSSYLTDLIKNKNKILSIIATSEDLDELYKLAKEIEDSNVHDLEILILPRFYTNDFEDTKRIKVLNVNKINIFEIYKISSFLITKTSTAALESLYMSIPTFIFEKDNSIFKLNYPYLTSLNYFSSVYNFNEQLTNNSYTIPIESDVNKIYQNDVIDKFNSTINNVDEILNA